ncbi:hypothetical protein BJV78DRAFT_1179283, partial [Lactifluus subvellereus]
MPPRYLTRPLAAMKGHPYERIDKGAEPQKSNGTTRTRSPPRVKSTWEHVLRKNTDLPDDWIASREVL